MNAILHAEVGHRRTLSVWLDIYVLAEQGIDVLNAFHECLILENLFLTGITQALKEHHRIMLHIVVELRIKIAEQVAGLIVPYPPHVVGNLVQALQFLGKCCPNGQHFPNGSVCVICFNFHNLTNVIFELLIS